MTATFAPSPWPATMAPAAPGAWRFGREIEVDLGVGLRPALQWVQRRNGSVTPRLLGAVYLSLCFFACAVSAGFWWQGAPLVSAFAAVELVLVGVALRAYARHAGDREVLTLAGRSLAVEQHLGSRVARADFPAEWLAVEPVAAQGSLIELSARGQSVHVGRFLRPEMRAAFAQELRRALRRALRPEPPTRSDLE